MTNRHVVYDEDYSLGVADAIGVADSGRAGGTELRGTVVAVSDYFDLALVRVAGLDAAAIDFRPTSIDLASDVMILGYPMSEVLGTGLKATRGIVSALPDETRGAGGDFILFDATADHGNSGGPVIDDRGRVVAVLTIGLNTKASLTGGVPAATAVTFASEHVPDFQPANAGSSDADSSSWSDLTQLVGPSVVRLTCYYRAGVPVVSGAANRTAASENVFEDRTCPHCNGRSVLACPRKGCVEGHVSVKYIVETIVGQAVVRQAKFRDEVCSTCSGRSAVDCPGCSDGFDSFLR